MCRGYFIHTGGTMIKNKGIAEQTIRAVRIKADGTREDLGVVAYYSKNPLKNLLFKMRRKLKW